MLLKPNKIPLVYFSVDDAVNVKRLSVKLSYIIDIMIKISRFDLIPVDCYLAILSRNANGA